MIWKLIRFGYYAPNGGKICRGICISSILQIPRVPSVKSTTILNKDDHDEVLTLTEVESNLFENAKKLHKPVNARELFKQLKPKESTQKTLQTTSTQQQKDTLHNRKPISVIKDQYLDLEYIKLSLNDPLLSKLMLSAKSRKHRNKQHQLVIEGTRLILEAIECNCKLQTVLFKQKDQLAAIASQIRPLKNVQIVKVPQQDLRIWSTLTTCPGLIAIFDRPGNVHELTPKISPYPITVVCDNIREPSNLGSIIRSCAALPCYQVVVLKGCCDPWDTKALRAGCGGQFRVKIIDDVLWDNLENFLPDDFSVFIAESNVVKLGAFDNSAHGISSYTDVHLSSNHNILVIGGETHGVSEDAHRFLASHRIGSYIHIPIAKGVDSLNTASALTLIIFEMRNFLKDKLLPSDMDQR